MNRLYRKHEYMNGMNCLKRVEKALKTQSVPDDQSHRGVVHYEFLQPSQTVNKEYYLSVMRRLREAVRLKRPDLWKDNSWFLHYDNAPSHIALVLRDHFAKNSTHIVPQPPYSPDLAPCDFWLFAKLKRPLRGHRFESIEEIQAESKKELKAIPEIEFNKVLMIGKNVGISVLYRLGTTLKGMK